MQNYRLYFRRLKKWMFDAFPLWLFLGVVALAMSIPFLYQLNPVDHVYYTGFLLQLFAFSTIIYRINLLRKYLSDDNRNFIGAMIDGLKHFPRIFEKLKVYKIDAKGILKSSGSVATVVTSTDKPLEQKVADLEEKQKALKKELDEAEGKLNERINEILNETRKHIKKLNDDIKSSIKLRNDSLNFEIVWFVWLIIGLTVKTFSEVIGSWFI